MILNTEKLKKVTDSILPAVDSSVGSELTDSLELYVQDKVLYICVTNKEYFVKSKLPIEYDVEFHATVNAMLFLKLVSQITTEDVTLSTDERALHIKGNGNYKLPLIFDGDSLLTLPKIEIHNVTCEMQIESEVLQSILKYNSKELTKGIISRPIQKMYYVDEEGAVTFTTGACVNMFKLEKPVKMLLNGKVVKLFKLFDDGAVKFTLGYDSISESIVQTKVSFDDGNTELTAILACDDSALKSFPVRNIRGRAQYEYPYSITINKNGLIQSINRLMILMNRGNKDGCQYVAKFVFDKDGVTVSDDAGENTERVGYANTCDALATPYTALFDLSDIKSTLQTCEDEYLTFKFGDSSALVIYRAGLYNVVPEYQI